MLLKKLRSRNFFVEKRFGLLYTLTTMNTTPTGRSGRKNLTAPYALIQGSFWMSFCTAVSFASVYLLGLHYTNSQLGLILAAGNLLGALLGPELSAWVDRSDRVSALSLIPPVLTLQAVSLVILSLNPVKGIVTTVAYTLYIAFTLTVNSLNLKLYSDAIYYGLSVNYGLARGIGSAAYVLLSTFLGMLIEGISLRLVPLSGLLMCAFQFAAFLIIRPSLPDMAVSSADSKTEASSMFAFLRGNRKFSVLLLGVALLFFSHNIIVTFLINITNNVGGDTSDMGLINAFMAAVEIPVMMLYHTLFGKRRPGSLMRVAFLFFVLKAIAIALARSIPALLAAFLLQAPSFSLYTSAIVPYVDEVIPYKDSAKAQSLAYTMTTVGSVLASLLGGVLYDRTTVNATLWVAFGICTVGALVAVFGVQEGK